MTSSSSPSHYQLINTGDGSGFHIVENGFDYGFGYDDHVEAWQELRQILWLEQVYSPPRKA